MEPSTSLSQPRRTTYARPPRATCRWTAADPSAVSEKNATRPRTRRAIRGHERVVGIEHDPAIGLGHPATADFTSASSGSVWMPCRSMWSDETLVITQASFDS